MEPIGLGTAIICSSAIFAIIFGIVAIVFKLINSRRNPCSLNPGQNSSTEKRFSAINEKFKDVRWKDSCEEIVKRIEGTQVGLKETMENGFTNVVKQLDEIKRKLP